MCHPAAVLRSYKKIVSVKDLEKVFAQVDEARRKAAVEREASQDNRAELQLQADPLSFSIGAASVNSGSNSEPDYT